MTNPVQYLTVPLFRLELYSNNMADHHLVTDLLPCLARLVLTQQLGDLHLSPVQQVSFAFGIIYPGVGQNEETKILLFLSQT